jgi:two-component system NtrC family sensor kinase
MTTDRPLLLIVDDDPIVHQLISGILVPAGYDVRSAHRGDEAVQMARDLNPDLILLDVMMPEMDGFEVINRLQTDKSTSDIPVIFLSAKVDPADKVRALQLGATDFIGKPFDRAELLARIRAHIKIRSQEKALQEYSQQLEKMVEQRTQQLIHADRLASLGILSAGIAHEINNPAAFISGNLYTLKRFWETLAPYIQDHLSKTPDDKMAYILNEMPDLIEAMRTGADQIVKIANGLRAFSRKDDHQKDSVILADLIEEALDLTSYRIKHNVTVEKDIAPDLPLVHANAQQLVQVFVNLIVNAADAIGPRTGRLTIIGRYSDDGRVRLDFIDDGAGIPPDKIKRIFEPFFTTKSRDEGTGLGLSITQGILADHNGAIAVDSSPGEGAQFTIHLPVMETR